MKRLLITLCIVVSGLRLNAQSDLLLAGTYVPISFTHIVCSHNNHQIKAYVSSDVYGDSGKLVIRGGQDVKIKIERKKARGFGRAGWVEVSAISVTAVDGTEILLNGNDRVEGLDDKGRAWLIGIGSMLLLPPVGILAGFLVKGQDVCIDQIPIVKVVSTTEIKTRR